MISSDNNVDFNLQSKLYQLSFNISMIFDIRRPQIRPVSYSRFLKNLKLKGIYVPFRRKSELLSIIIIILY